MEIKNKDVKDLFLSKSETSTEKKPAAKSKDSEAGASFSAALDSKLKRADATDDLGKSEKPALSEKPKSKQLNVASKKGEESEKSNMDEKPMAEKSEVKSDKAASTEGQSKAQPKESKDDDDKKKVVADNSLVMPFGMLPAQMSPLPASVELKAVDQASVPTPIAQFMVSMESELGVKPEQMLQAFQKLAPEQLLSKPEETIQSVISNLNLSAPDAEKASQMYAKMLAEMSKAQQNQKAMIEPDKMALMGALQGSQVAAGAGKPINLESVVPASKPGEKLSVPKANVGEAQLAKAKLNVPTESVPTALALEGNESFATDSQSFSSDQSFGKFQDSKNEALPTATAVTNPMVQNANQEIKKGQGMNAYGVPNQALKVQTKQVELKANAVKEEAPAESARSSESLNASPVVDSQAAIGKPAMANGVAGSTATTALAGTSNQSQVDRNQVIQQVLDSARVLSQKGGGEMSVSLKNTELGQIHLKVAAHGNDVSISMVAEQSDTKKLLESNIRDLKMGLSQHSINADSIKVSVADNSSNNDFRQNPQGHPDFGASREFAGAFQQQQREQRESMMGFMSSGNGIGSLNDRIQSRRIDSVSNGQVNGRKGNSSVLNLVA